MSSDCSLATLELKWPACSKQAGLKTAIDCDRLGAASLLPTRIRFSGGGKPAPHSNPSMPIECHSAWVGKEVLENSRPLVGLDDGLFGCAKNDSVRGSTVPPCY